MKNIVFVTSNEGKRKSAQKYFDEDQIKISCYDFDIKEPEINDIEYIAKYKVMEAYKKVNKPCIALDVGFYIPNYPNNPNFPGAFVKRELIDKLGIDGLLKNMQNVKNRECYFKECLAYYNGKEVLYFYGISKGTLSYKQKGLDNDKKWSDLWYIFIPNNCSKTLAEMTNIERDKRNDNHISALKEFCTWFINNEKKRN